jgi:beta-fructofuranosidase
MTETLDPRFPALHRVHPRGWINDPNGIHRTADGRWHVFFQYNPASARHERIHWGHMSSLDLASWREEPLGPVPRPGEPDQDGCWSGVGLLDQAPGEPVAADAELSTGAVVDGGSSVPAVPTLVYSGVDGTENQLARVLVARLDASGTELVRPGVVAAEVPEVPGLIGVRDPYLFEHGGKRWGIQGAGVSEEGRFVPTLLLYSCEDLERWELVGRLLHGDDPIAVEHSPADLWECPQLVHLDGRCVLLLSRWGHPSTHERSTLQVDYLVGDLVDGPDGAPRFAPTGGGQVDIGPDFYAPQAVVDAEAGRVLAWGWSWEGQQRTQEQTDAQGWAGALTFPRELRLDGEELRSVPAPELRALRAEALSLGAVTGADGGGTPAVGTVGISELLLEVPARAEVRTRGLLVVEILGADGTAREVFSADDGPATVFLDASLLEHLPDAASPRTLRLYPAEGEQVRVRGALAEAWRLEVPAR